MNDKVFDRIEKKYLISKKQKKQFLRTIKQHMRKDHYFSSEVMNIYFDTDQYDLIIQSIDSYTFKEKLRARSYSGYDRVYMEIKTKLYAPDNNVGYKRRVLITQEDFDELINRRTTLVKLANRKLETKNHIQIATEIDYLIKELDLKPKIQITYNRESYKTDDGLRITFDENLRYRNHNLSFNETNHDKIYFKDKRNIIMEVKAQGVIPLWLSGQMSKLKVFPEQFSKIGKVYERITKEQNV